MKTYGSRKATEFSKKQIGVIYYRAKSGAIKVERWVIKDFYDLADYYGYDDNRSVEDAEREILAILDKVFNGTNEEVQNLIDRYTEKHWNLMGRKSRERADRSLQQ